MYGEVKVANEFLFTKKVSGEVHKFTRTVLSTWIREDGKRFTPQNIYKYYEESTLATDAQKLMEIQDKLWRYCDVCRSSKPPSYFYNMKAVCKICISQRYRDTKQRAGVRGRPRKDDRSIHA